MEFEWLIAAIILLGMLFVATIDIAFSHVTDVGMRRLSSEQEAAGNKNASALLREILENRARFRFLLSSAIQILLVLFVVVTTVAVAPLFAEGYKLMLVALAIGLVATALFRQVLPRIIVRRNYERTLLRLLPVIRPLHTFALAITSPFVFRNADKDDTKLDDTSTPDAVDSAKDSNDDLSALMEVGEAEGIIEEDEREMIETMVEFGETRAGEIMTPRTEIVAVSAGTLIKDARDVIIEEKVSRLPVYRNNIDAIEGVIYVRDLLAALATGRKEDAVETIMRDAFFVPETKTADELLKSMQREHVQLAIVIDEYGGVAGLVTVEDLIEEIVGEIEDEDIEREEVIEIRDNGDGTFDVLGSTDIDKIEDLFDLELEDEDYSTIAGMVVTENGSVPKVGEKLTLKDLDVEVIEADEKRITLLRICKAGDDSQSEMER